MKERQKEIETALEEKSQDLWASINSFHGKIANIEKETLWKIKDCEELLKSRVSERYVEQSINSLEKRVFKDLDDKSSRLED